MSKKNNNFNNKIYVFNKEETILQMFKKICGDYDTMSVGLIDKEKIIKALKIINAKITNYDVDNVPENIKKQIIEWYDYYEENYSPYDYIEEAILETWDKYPEIFELAEYFIQKMFEEKGKLAYEKLSGHQKFNVKLLVDYIMNCKNDKVVGFGFEDESFSCSSVGTTMTISSMVSNEEKKEIRTKLLTLISLVFHTDGQIEFRHYIKDKTVINIFISSNGSICKIPAPALEYYLKTCDDQEFAETDITFK